VLDDSTDTVEARDREQQSHGQYHQQGKRDEAVPQPAASLRLLDLGAGLGPGWPLIVRREDSLTPGRVRP
jgi:hypothetical protein